jgi:competence protein ComEC
MVLGQDDAIADDVRDDFERSGLAHLLAVSGQNVLLLCALVLALAAAAGVPLRTRLVAAVVLVALYVPLAGAGPSIQRAGVMGIAGLAAALAGRPASRWYALGLAAAVTLALNPYAAAEPGWQLSFAAVAGLMALVPRMREPLARRMPEPIADAAAITVAATLATAPLLALHFEEVSLVSLPANLAAAPVVAPIMWLGMLGIAAAQVAPELALPLNLLAAPLLGYLEWVAEVAAGAPMAAVPVRLPGPAGLLGGYAALGVAGWAVIRGGRRLRARPPSRALLGSLAVVGALAFVLWPRAEPPRLAPGELAVTFLDVGQGDATLLQRDGVAILVDTGPPGGPILRRLDEAGVERLDLLVITHAQADHEGMALRVIDELEPRLVLDGGAGWPTAVQRALPAALARAHGRRVAARAGQSLELGGVHLDVLWPPAPPDGWRPEGDPNGRAVVAHVRAGDFDLLLPADAESDVTAALDLPRVEALKVAHHGSDDPGLPAMLDRLAPRIAAVEVGEGNTYGHPTPETMRALGVVPEVVRTDRDGSVRLRVLGGRMTVERGV